MKTKKEIAHKIQLIADEAIGFLKGKSEVIKQKEIDLKAIEARADDFASKGFNIDVEESQIDMLINELEELELNERDIITEEVYMNEIYKQIGEYVGKKRTSYGDAKKNTNLLLKNLDAIKTDIKRREKRLAEFKEENSEKDNLRKEIIRKEEYVNKIQGINSKFEQAYSSFIGAEKHFEKTLNERSAKVKSIQAVIKKKEAELDALYLDFSQGHRDYVDSNMELKELKKEQSSISETNDMYGIAVKSLETIAEDVDGKENKVEQLKDKDLDKSEKIKVLEEEVNGLKLDLEDALYEEDVVKSEILFIESTLEGNDISVDNIIGVDNKIKIWKADVEKFSNAVGEVAEKVIPNQDYTLNDGNNIDGENPLIELMERIKYVFRFIEEDLDSQPDEPIVQPKKKQEVNKAPLFIGALGLIGTLLYSK
tara:strand:- start:10074 stop:11348 length:1275 start_codon:yes stop_codon:yes gene_type:complete